MNLNTKKGIPLISLLYFLEIIHISAQKDTSQKTSSIFSGENVQPRMRIIIDNDFGGDPDGLFELVQHLLSPSVEIRAIIGSHLKAGDGFDRSNETARFQKMYDERKSFFNKTFVNDIKKTMGLIGGGPFGPSNVKPVWKIADVQTAYAIGLALHAFNEENIPFMVKNLKESVERKNTGDDGIERPSYSLMTGFIGTAWISKALSDHGYSDLAYKLLQNNQFPSWLYAVDQGATTIWERLNGYTTDKGFGGNNSMNSFNHYSFGAIGQWMMAYSLGIQRDAPGFKKFILQPVPDPTGEMKWAKGYYDSDYGRINSSWKVENKKFTYSATVPANTRATLYLPAIDIKSIQENGKPVLNSRGIKFIKFENGKAVYELKSGTYQFSSGL